MEVRIIIVDDHPMLRNGLRQAIAQHPGFSLVGEAASGGQALKVATQFPADVVVLDIHLPDMTGIEAARKLLAAYPLIKIIIFSSDAGRTLVDEALHAGVCAYVLKQGAVEELFHAIEKVMTGQLYLSAEVSASILQDYQKGLRHEPKTAKPELSDRDKLLLRLVAEGRRNKEIATELGIGTKSVEAYRSRLMKRTGCASSAELVRYAIREGIATP
jgi:DNA-binding NarL/FixJ family response regulator